MWQQDLKGEANGVWMAFAGGGQAGGKMQPQELVRGLQGLLERSTNAI